MAWVIDTDIAAWLVRFKNQFRTDDIPPEDREFPRYSGDLQKIVDLCEALRDLKKVVKDIQRDMTKQTQGQNVIITMPKADWDALVALMQGG